MELPVLRSAVNASTADVVRYFHKLVGERSIGAGEGDEQLDVGRVVWNAALSDVIDANCVFDVALQPGVDARDAISQVDTFFAAKGLVCRRWVMNPSADVGVVRPLETALLDTGFVRRTSTIVRLVRNVPRDDVTSSVSVIPARAAFRQARELMGDAIVTRLDDPRYDVTLALADGHAVAAAGVLVVGELGLVDDVIVAVDQRVDVRRTMLERTIDACVRAQLKHVLAGLSDAASVVLFESCGFERVAELTEFVRV
jgi:hypothetical protein